MRLKWLVFGLFVLFLFFTFCECHPVEKSRIPRSTVSSIVPQSRQFGFLGFTALGAMMFPVLVSLGMATFVSHLPTVFKELASEFGIPSTPPSRLFLFRRKRSKEWDQRVDELAAFVFQMLMKESEFH